MLSKIMVKKLKIPFIKSRGYECGQTCVAMMIKYFKPDVKIDFEKFNKIIHHVKGKATFPLQNAILLNRYGIKTKCFSSDDIPTTKDDPDIFKKWFGDEYDKLIHTVDIDSYNWMATEGKKLNLFKKRKTSFDEIVNLFTKGYVVAFPIDWNTLIGKKGPYQGHFIILSGLEDKNTLLIHDPDNGPYIKYSREILEKSYNHPVITDDLYIAYRIVRS